MRTTCLVLLVAALGLTTGGCTRQAVYAALATQQRNRCLDEVDGDTRERCLSGTDRSYDDYERQRATP